MLRWRSAGPLSLALCCGYFLVLLDVTVVNVALPNIGAELHAGSDLLAWVVNAYALPLAALLLVSGAIGDLVGHRTIVAIGMVTFGVASGACALAPNIGLLIAARVVQGLGAALTLPGTLALLLEQSDSATRRNSVVGAWAAIGGAALPAGPLVGGILLQTSGWRAVFWLSVPVIAIALIPVFRLRHPNEASTSKRSIDWLGSGLLVAALTSLTIAILQVRASLLFAGILSATAVVALIGFSAWERHVREPLIAVPRSARGPLSRAAFVAALMNCCALGGLFLLTQELQDVHKLTPLMAGVMTLAAMLPLPLLGAPAGVLTGKIGPWRTSCLGALIAATGAIGIGCSLAAGGVSLWLTGCLAVWGAGLGILTPAIVAAAVDAIPTAPGLASGLSNTARQSGGALGIALSAAIAGPSSSASFTHECVVLFIASGIILALAGGLAFRGWRTSTIPDEHAHV